MDEDVKTMIGKAMTTMNSFPITSNNLEIQRIVLTHQDRDFQLKCKVRCTLWCCDMED